MDRVFLDANVLFSAAYRGDSGLLRLWGLRNTALVSSLYAVTEARRNLDTPERIDRLEKLIERIAVFDNAESRGDIPKGIMIPENDVPVLKAAIGIKATHLISGDQKAFGKYYGKSIKGVSILKPSAYLAEK